VRRFATPSGTPCSAHRSWIRYDNQQFRLRVRDDGKGMDSRVLSDRARGHYGLSGMRERAKLIGASWCWSEVDRARKWTSALLRAPPTLLPEAFVVIKWSQEKRRQ